MSYLLDTCLLSELVKPTPSPPVLTWLGQRDESELYVSVLTLGELTKGLETLPESKRRQQVQAWIANDMRHRFQGRWIDIDASICTVWGKLLAASESRGYSFPAVDALIAAAAVSRGLILVTRNTKDFANSGVGLLNPWL